MAKQAIYNLILMIYEVLVVLTHHVELCKWTSSIFRITI